MRLWWVLILLALPLSGVAEAQLMGPPRPDRAVTPQPEPDLMARLDRPLEPASDALNPMRIIGDAARFLPGANTSGVATGGQLQGGPAGPIPPGSDRDSQGGLSVALNIMVLLTALTLVPSVLLMCTCFVRILIVLGLLRQAIGAQSVPPAQVITALALFLTIMVMAPTVNRVMDEAIHPWQRGEITDYGVLWDRAKQPMRDYMFDQIEATGNWSAVYTLLNYKGVDTSENASLVRADVDTATLTASYMISELKVAFLLGFRVYLPFLVIDMVIASVLISMSMMMLPPVLISLPFKLLLFVLVDGWTLVIGSLLESFIQDGMSSRLSAEAAMMPMLFVICWLSPEKPASAIEGVERPRLMEAAMQHQRRFRFGLGSVSR